jgi:hypothetical protein
MKSKTFVRPLFLCAWFVAIVTAQAQIAEFQFVTSSPGFGGELFFKAPSGNTAAGDFLEGNSFITTPDGTFTVSKSMIGGPIFENPPPDIWSPSGITELNLNLYEVINSQIYDWDATPTSISDTPVNAIPADPSASGTWEYLGPPVPEPGPTLLAALGATVLFLRPLLRK